MRLTILPCIPVSLYPYLCSIPVSIPYLNRSLFPFYPFLMYLLYLNRLYCMDFLIPLRRTSLVN